MTHTSNQSVSTWLDPSLTQVRDLVWSYVLPSICLFGILTNSINIFIFKNKDLKSSMYKYFLLHSIAELCYLLICFVYFCLNSIFLPVDVKNTYPVKLFEMYAYHYLTTVMALYMISIELTISIKRLFIVLNGRLDSSNKLGKFIKILFVFFIGSALLHSPFLLSADILTEPCGQKNTSYFCYKMIMNDFGNGQAFKRCNTAVSVYRGIFAPGILLIVNSIMLFKFKKQIRKKRNLFYRLRLVQSK